MDINGFPPMSMDEFFSIPTGSHIYNYGNDQCVALANLYTVSALQQPLPPGIGSAYQWWTTYSQKPELYNYFDQVGEARRGDIFVSIGGVYDATHGHIGVVEADWDGATFGTMENGYWNGVSSMRRFRRNMNNVYGFLRPKSLIPPSPVTEYEEDMYAKIQYADGWAGVWNMATGQVAWIGIDADYRQLNANLKTYSFQNEADFNSFKSRYPFALPKPDLSSIEINVDAIASAVASKLKVGGVAEDVTTKADILEAIELNYPGDK